MLAAVGGVLASNLTSGDWAVQWFEAAKAGIQVVAVGVAGGALAAAWRGITARGQAAAATNDKIRAEFAELVDPYSRVRRPSEVRFQGPGSAITAVVTRNGKDTTSRTSPA